MSNYPNGKPVLVDQYGKPFRTTEQGRVIPDGDAVPSGIYLPHGWTFLAKYSGAYHTYLHDKFDEALRHAREDAEAMRRDSYVMALIQERQLAVTSLNWHLEVPDDKDPYQNQVKDGITRIVKGIPFLRRMLQWWSEAIWYGKYGVQVEWGWRPFHDRPEQEDGGKNPEGMDSPGLMDAMAAMEDEEPVAKATRGSKGEYRRGLTVVRALPVNGDKIGHQYDHTPYVLVNAAESHRLPNARLIQTSMGRALSLRGSWRERFIIHKHLQYDMDYFAQDQAEAIHGVGIRSQLFWTYFLRMQWLGDITDFFDRVGLGITMWKYPRNNAAAKAAVEQAAREQSNRAHILVPVDPDDMGKSGTGVERLDVPTSGADALVKLIEYLDKSLERLVVGQEGSSKGSSSGLGNEASAEFQRDTKSKITMQDAALMAESISGNECEPGLINVIQKYTFPDADFPLKWVFDVEKGESQEKLQAAKTLVELGLDIKADEVRQAAGYSKPADGDELVEPPDQGGDAGGAGGDPMAALMGGMTGGDAGGDAAGEEEQPGQPSEAAESEQEETEPGDFMQSLMASRDASRRVRVHYGTQAPLQYGWKKDGEVGKSKRGLPIYKWVATPPDKGVKQQTIEPGSSGRGKGKEAAEKPESKPKEKTPKEPKAKPPKEQKPKKEAKPKKEKPTVEGMADRIGTLNMAEITDETVKEIADSLTSMTIPQLKELMPKIGMDATSVKRARKDAIVEAIVANAKASENAGDEVEEVILDDEDEDGAIDLGQAKSEPTTTADSGDGEEPLTMEEDEPLVLDDDDEPEEPEANPGNGNANAVKSEQPEPAREKQPQPSNESGKSLSLRPGNPHGMDWMELAAIRKMRKLTQPGASMDVAVLSGQVGIEVVEKMTSNGLITVSGNTATLTKIGDEALHALPEIRRPKTIAECKEIIELLASADLNYKEDEKLQNYLGITDQEMTATYGSLLQAMVNKLRREQKPIGERISGAAHLHSLTQDIAALGAVSDSVDAEIASLQASMASNNKRIESIMAKQDYYKNKGRQTEVAAAYRANTKIEKRLLAIRPSVDAVNARARQMIKERLNAKNPLVVQHSGLDTVDPRVQKAAGEALSFLANLVEKKPGDKDMNIKYVPFTGRANYDSREGTGVGIVNCDPGDGVYVHVHEIAHGLEEDIPGALAASLEFLDHRCGSEPFQKLKDVFPVAKFEEYETGRKDNFDKAMGPTKAWYIGKDYQGRNTEVISVGMDTLYTDPVNFAKKDPEYFAFILGILDGSTRSI